MTTRIRWDPAERIKVFTEAQRLLRAGLETGRKQLWEEAQRVLPAEKQRPVMYSSLLCILAGQFKQWGITSPLPEPAPRVQRLAASPAVSLPAPTLNYCPSCGLDLRKVKFLNE